jgi:hypothetical protein
MGKELPETARIKATAANGLRPQEPEERRIFRNTLAEERLVGSDLRGKARERRREQANLLISAPARIHDGRSESGEPPIRPRMEGKLSEHKPKRRGMNKPPKRSWDSTRANHRFDGGGQPRSDLCVAPTKRQKEGLSAPGKHQLDERADAHPAGLLADTQ